MWVWIWTFCKLAGSVDFKNEGKWIVDETMFWILRTYIRLRHRSFAEKVVHDVWNPISINPEHSGYISVYRAGWRYKNLRNPTILTVGVCQKTGIKMWRHPRCRHGAFDDVTGYCPVRYEQPNKHSFFCKWRNCRKDIRSEWFRYRHGKRWNPICLQHTGIWSATLLFCWKQAQACSTRELSYASGSCENHIICGCGTLCSPIIFSIQTMLYQVSNL